MLDHVCAEEELDVLPLGDGSLTRCPPQDVLAVSLLEHEQGVLGKFKEVPPLVLQVEHGLCEVDVCLLAMCWVEIVVVLPIEDVLNHLIPRLPENVRNLLKHNEVKCSV